MVRNPVNPRMVSRISLIPEIIDCIIFWTKNSRPLIPFLHQLETYPYYFLFTITPYGNEFEKNMPPKSEIINTFIELSQIIGKRRVIWRYDPILFTDGIDEEYHCYSFEKLAASLCSHTDRCIISFLDMYNKCKRNLSGMGVKEAGKSKMLELVGMLRNIADGYGIKLVTCAEETDFKPVGVTNGGCIDGELIADLCGYSLDLRKDKNQRSACRCVESIDVGTYNTCGHACLYCYANSSPETAKRNVREHDPLSPLLLGRLGGDDIIVDRECKSSKKVQRNLFELL